MAVPAHIAELLTVLMPALFAGSRWPWAGGLAVRYRPRHGQCSLSQSKWGLNNWKCEPLSKWGIGKNNKDIDCNQPAPAAWVWSLLITPGCRGGGSWKCWNCLMFSQLGSEAEHRTEQIWAELKQKEGERGPAARQGGRNVWHIPDLFNNKPNTFQFGSAGK